MEVGGERNPVLGLHEGMALYFISRLNMSVSHPSQDPSVGPGGEEASKRTNLLHLLHIYLPTHPSI